MVELNAAVAFAMSSSVDGALSWIREIEQSGMLHDYHLLHAARAELLRRTGRCDDALIHYRRAAELARNLSERLYLERRIRELS